MPTWLETIDPQPLSFEIVNFGGHVLIEAYSNDVLLGRRGAYSESDASLAHSLSGRSYVLRLLGMEQERGGLKAILTAVVAEADPGMLPEPTGFGDYKSAEALYPLGRLQREAMDCGSPLNLDAELREIMRSLLGVAVVSAEESAVEDLIQSIPCGSD